MKGEVTSDQRKAGKMDTELAWTMGYGARLID